MCGIAGFIHLNNKPFDEHEDLAILHKMGNAINHRGPDDKQTLVWRNTGLIFNRLSIVDLQNGGQPFTTPDGRISAIINGEIYNHRDIRKNLAHHPFQSQSDCEVIPYLYLEHEMQMLQPVNGMFALALLDRKQNRLLLARDRIGIKPLFYCHLEAEKLLLFASELKGLFAHPLCPKQFDWVAALARNRTHDLNKTEHPSYFKGIERVPAGHILSIELTAQHIKTQPYWQLPDTREDFSIRLVEDYIEGYRELLTDSVQKRLMADVRFGTFLSGGIDSGAVTSIAAQTCQFPTFSVSTQSTIGNGEAQMSHNVASALQLPNHQVHFDWQALDIVPQDWQKILWHCELFEINAEQLYKFYLHQFAKQAYPDLKIILLGQGSDEFNGGYIEWLLNDKGPWSNDSWTRIGAILQGQTLQRDAFKLGITIHYQDMINSGLIRPDFIFHHANTQDPADIWSIYMGYHRRNLDHHLWHEDRTSSAHSIENRVPFLDHRLLEFIATIPRNHHPELFTNKAILRGAMRGIVPEFLQNHPKGYFFYGEDQRYTFYTMYKLLMDNEMELVEQAITGSDNSGGPLDADKFRDYALQIGNDPELTELIRLLQLVNMGMLAEMALQPPNTTTFRNTMPARDAYMT